MSRPSSHSAVVKMDIPAPRAMAMTTTMTTIVAFLAVAAPLQAHAHMIMANPVPYGADTLDNSPLTGTNYPCKVTSDPATFYARDGIDNTYAAGSVQTLSFKGSAVHGGGSCQLALTSDLEPAADTDWRVILSIESGCPSTDGSNVGTYNWTVPEDLAPGQYSFAWTWISKLAGQPEYYMNCAPITVTSSSSKRSDSEVAPRAADDYPELFVANLDSVNSCKTSPGTDVVFPDPGPNVLKLLTGATPSFASVSADGCVPVSQSQGAASLPTATAGGGDDASAGSGSGSSVSATGAADPVTTTTSSAVASGGVFATKTVTTPSSTETTIVTTGPAGASSNTAGGDTSSSSSSTTTSDLSVYVSPVVQSSRSSKGATSSSTPAPATATPTPGTSSSSSSSSSAGFATGGNGGGAGGGATTPASSSTQAPSSSTTSQEATTTSSSSLSSSSSSPASATPTGSGAGSSGGNSTTTGQKTGTCASEGTFNCVGAQYQQCASGAWTSMRSLPSGTTCQQGESSSLWARGSGANDVQVGGGNVDVLLQQLQQQEEEEQQSRQNKNTLSSRRVRRGAFGVGGRLVQG